MSGIRRKVLIVCRRAPCGSGQARDAVEVAMAFAAFEQPVALLFLGDGVLNLLPAAQPATQLPGSTARLLGTLPDYGIERLYVASRALSRHGLDPAGLAAGIEPLDAAGIADLVAAHDLVLSL